MNKFLSLRSKIYIKLAAFSLIELIIAISLIVILAATGFISIINYKNQQALRSASQEIVTLVRNAQDRSISQEGGTRWGVHFEHSAGGTNLYNLFQGLSYVTNTIVSQNILPSNLQFDIPAIGSSSTIIFSPISGLPNNPMTIRISLIGTPSSSSTIIISSNGEVQY